MQKYLVDTHVLIWAAAQTYRLPARVQAILADVETVAYASPVSACEITNKHRLGKLPGMDEAVADYPAWLTHLGFQQIPLTTGECAQAGLFDVPHAGPEDHFRRRLLAAQALAHNLPILSMDSQIDRFPIQRIW